MVAKCIIDKSIVIDENDNYGTLKIKICMVALREEFLYQQEKCLAVLASTSIITILHQNISAVSIQSSGICNDLQMPTKKKKQDKNKHRFPSISFQKNHKSIIQLVRRHRKHIITSRYLFFVCLQSLHKKAS